MKKKENEEPGYYAVIPASVRYDKKLPPYARLLYAEISSLCNKKGFCWAGNAYFAKLYDASERSVINWINSLKKGGYISVSFRYKPGKKEVDSRMIRLSCSVPLLPQQAEPEAPGGGENSFTTPSNEREEKPEPEDIGGGENSFTTPGNNFHHVVKKFSQGGETGFMDNIKINIKAAAADQMPPENEKPPPATAAAPFNGGNQSPAETAGEDIEALKTCLKKLSPLLIFDESFYPRALRHLSSRSLDLKFVSWLCGLCAKRKPENLAGYVRSIFFEERYVLLFRETSKPPPEAGLISCPACGAEYERTETRCPACGLRSDPSAEDIDAKKKFLSLPPDRRDEFSRRREEIISRYGFNFTESGPRLAALEKEFGLAAAEAG